MGKPLTKSKKITFFIIFNLISVSIIILLLEVFLNLFLDGHIRHDGGFLEDHNIYKVVNIKNAIATQKGPEFEYTIKINSQGFREPNDTQKEKKQKTKRVMFFGDSFTFGSGNDEKNTIPSLLDSILIYNNNQNFEVINCGISSYSTHNSVVYMEHIAKQFNPDILVLSLMPNDLFRVTQIDSQYHTSVETDSDLGKNYMSKNNIDIDRNYNKKYKWQIPVLAKRILLSSDYFYSKVYLSSFRGEYFKKNISELLKNKLDITTSILDRAIKFCKMRKVKLVLLYMPQQFEVIYKSNEFENKNKIDPDFISNYYKNYASKNNINFLNTKKRLVNSYQANREDLYFRLDGHLNYFGNKIIAESLFQSGYFSD